MTVFRDRATGAYPLRAAELRLRVPNIGLPAVFDSKACALVGVDPVAITEPPEYDFSTHNLVEGAPENVNGKWRQTWMLEPIPPLVITNEMIDEERDLRIVSGFEFGGVRFQSRPQDRENIMGAFALAAAALSVGGKQPGDLRWHGGEEDFVFIAEDNSRMPMDPIAVLGLGQAAAKQKSDLTFAANDLKKIKPLPSDYAADKHWPAA